MSLRQEMVDRQLHARGVADPRVLEAMRRVPREDFVPPELVEFAYEDSPLPIAEEQTISQPYIVARMIEALELEPGSRVLPPFSPFSPLSPFSPFSPVTRS